MFKLYGRKSSFKKDIESANILLHEISISNAKNFLEIGVYQGVMAKNICETLFKNYKNNFMYYGIDLFEQTNEDLDQEEFTLKKNIYFSNPLKNFWFKYILNENPHSELSVKRFLKKYEKNIKLFKGFSKNELAKVPIETINFAFIDGGHSYETVKKDINFCINGMEKKSIIICDDYDVENYGVKKAVDEIINKVNSVINLNKRLVKIII